METRNRSRRRNSFVAVATAMCVTALASSGCFGSCHYVNLSIRWNESGLYNRVPHDGLYGAYLVDDHPASRTKEIIWLNATGEVRRNGQDGTFSKNLEVNSTDSAYFVWSAKEAFSNEETYASLEKVFSDLRIQPLTLPRNTNFRWADWCG